MNKPKKWPVVCMILALICLGACITGIALNWRTLTVEENSFETGRIGIDLNNGQAVITPEEYLFEPGMTVEKPFYIANTGTFAVYYKLYFEEISGPLAEVLDATILDKDGNIRTQGKLAELTLIQALAQDSILEVGQREELILRLHFPRGEGNEHQDKEVNFRLSAMAVQTKNNPGKEFD